MKDLFIISYKPEHTSSMCLQMSRRATPIEVLEDAFKRADQGEKWYRYFAALAQRQSRLIKKYRQVKQKVCTDNHKQI